MVRRLFIYTCRRKGSVSSTVLDLMRGKENDELLQTWNWYLRDRLKVCNISWSIDEDNFQEIIDMKYALFSDNMSIQQKQLFAAVQEFKNYLDSFDEVIVAVPMHNFGPSVEFKNLIDILVQPNIAVSYEGGRAKGLMKNNKWSFVCTAGGHSLESEGDFLIPWLRQVMKFIGVNDVHVLSIPGTASPNFSLDKVDLDAFR